MRHFYAKLMTGVFPRRTRRPSHGQKTTREWTEEEAQNHNTLTKRGWSLIRNQILLNTPEPPSRLDETSKVTLYEALQAFEEALKINPEAWSSMWAIGKIHQRLQQTEKALFWFSQAHSINPDNPDVAREAGLEALDLGKSEEAIYFCQSAVRLSPDDPGLVANLAWAYLIAGKIKKAQQTIAQSLKSASNDEISQCAARIIDEVANGSRPIPKTLLEISGHD